jgi:hypothetical protein
MSVPIWEYSLMSTLQTIWRCDTTTSNVTHAHIQLPTHFHLHFQFHLQLTTHFHHTFQFHIWSHPITHPLSPPLPISHLGTSNYTLTFITNPNFTHGHLQSSTHFHYHFQFHTWTHLNAHDFDHYFKFHTWAASITHPLSPPLPIFTPGKL